MDLRVDHSTRSPLAPKFQDENKFFEIHRTPPEEKRRADKAAQLAASQEVSILLLTPFTSTPRISFDRIKLGSSAVRQLIVKNPGEKSLDVSLERLPSEEKGFEVDYVSFRLGGREETTLLIGWTPLKGGNVRDNIVVKFGNFRSQIILIGSCLAPEEKKPIRVPRSVKPLAPKNSQKPKGRPTYPASKLNSAPKITIPQNPVVRKNVSPIKRLSEPAGIGTNHTIPEVYSTNDAPSRRETFVRERPAPARHDVLESTPKLPDKTFSSGRNDVMGPPCLIPSERRQTFLPDKFNAPDSDKENMIAPDRRTTFQPSDLDHRFGSVRRRETYVKLPSTDSWTPQKINTKGDDRKKWEAGPLSFGNLSGLRSLNETGESCFSEAIEESCLSMDVNKYCLSPVSKPTLTKVEKNSDCVKTAEDCVLSMNVDKYCLSPAKEPDPSKEQKTLPQILLTEMKEASLSLEPLNLSVKGDPKIYQPDVSDISLAEVSLNLTENEAGLSMAVNMSEFGPERDDELEPDLKDMEDRAIEDEIDRLAVARAASGCRDEITNNTQTNVSGNRLSSGTMIKSSPSLHASFLPDITDLEISIATPSLDIVETKVLIQEELIVSEKEVVREEVVEEVIEYEYEVVGDQRRCVGQKNLGRTVTVQEQERHVSTPTKEFRTSEMTTVTVDKAAAPGPALDVCEISKLIENDLCINNPKFEPRSVKLTKSELDSILALSELSRPQRIDRPRTPEPQTSDTYTGLPGLKGSPRFSQNAASSQSFLLNTVNETSFMPPSPDDPRRCSTGVKSKGNENENIEVSVEIKKALFSDEHQQPGEEFVPLSTGGYKLPVIPDAEPGSPDGCRLSSETYIAAQDEHPLSTIQEMDEQTQITTSVAAAENEPISVDKGQPSRQPLQQQTENLEEEKKLTQVQVNPRTPLRPKRSTIQYTSRPIENILKETGSSNPSSEPETANGLMFVSLSPGVQEKRKSADSNKPIKKTDFKKSRVSSSASKVSGSTRVVACKNPSQPKPMNAAKARMSLQRPSSNPPKSSVSRRSLQPTRTLNLKTNKPTVAHHPNPFASRNRYYDERWVEKQEKGFSNWLNFILTPQGLDDSSSAVVPGTVDVAKLWSQCSQDVKVPRAPTREVMSMRAYTARREMNRLRRASCKLWQSRAFAQVIGRLEVEIEKLRLVVRKDKQINKDVGMKQAILSLILSYNPLWLRIGLETVFGELLPVHGNSDLVGLSRFIVTRLISCPHILAEFAHPTVPHSYREGHQDALNKFTLKKFLELIYFLDAAKEGRLIQHNPCLFCPDSKIKSSRDILFAFSRDYLSGEGDIIKHLAYLGYEVKHKQTTLDEFDYAVTSVSSDLRCGLRLTKVAELLTGANLSLGLRVPAVSRLQKVHNTEVGLKELRKSCSSIPTNISAKDIVDGHREKTLSLLWNIIFGFQLSVILDVDKLREEILHLKRSLKVRIRLGDEAASKGMKFLTELQNRSPGVSSDSDLQGEDVALLKEWAQLVTAHYNVEVENWTVSWCDGRGLCFLMHHYQPALLDRQHIHQDTTLTSLSCSAALDDSLEFSYGHKGVDKNDYENLLENEKKNFKLLLSKVTELGGVPILISPGDMSNTIPDEKVTLTFIGYLAARLLDISREIKAARTIQLAWRKFFAIKREEQIKVETAAANTIQRAVRRFLKIRRQQRYQAAAIRIQAAFRGYRARRLAANLRAEKRFQALTGSVILIQSVWRGQAVRLRLKRDKARIVKIQSVLRAWIARKKFLRLRRSAVLLQQRFRANKAGRVLREALEEKRSAAARIQGAWRRFIIRRNEARRHKAAVKIQARLRGYVARKRFLRLKQVVTLLQVRFRANKMAKLQRSQFLAQKRSSIVIQSWFKMRIQASKYQALRRNIIRLQSLVRGFLARKRLETETRAALKIQRKWRSVLGVRKAVLQYQDQRKKVVLLQSMVRMHQQRTRFNKLRSSIVLLQAHLRGFSVRARLNNLNSAALIIQRRWRANMIMKTESLKYKRMKSSAVVLQSWTRMVLARKKFLAIKRSAVLLQSLYRGKVVRSRAQLRDAAARKIQQVWRATLISRQVSKDYQEKRSSAVTIQSCVRMYHARKRYELLRKSVSLIQSHYRGNRVRERIQQEHSAAARIQRRWRATMLARRTASDYQEKRAGVLRIQTWYRMVIARSCYLRLKRSTVGLQAACRGNNVRREWAAKRVAATKIQQFWRSWMQTRREQQAYLRTRQQIILIQSFARMNISRRKYSELRKSAILLQALARGRRARAEAAAKKESVLKIQQYWRSYQEMKRQREKFCQLKASVVKIQTQWRMIIAARRYKVVRRSILTLQKNVRTFLAVRRYQKLLEARRIQHESTVRSTLKIQAWYRSIIKGREIRENYLKERNLIISMQARRRGKVQRSEFLQLKSSSIKVQAHFRMKQEKRKFLLVKKSCVVLQRWYRACQAMRTARASFLRTRAAAIILQTCVRRAQARRQFLEYKHSTIVLQSHARRMIAERKFLALKRSAILLQRSFRLRNLGRAERNNFLIKKQAAVKIQSWWRMIQCRASYLSVLDTIILLQAAIRGHQARTTFTNLKTAATTIQKHFRRHRLMCEDRARFESTRAAVCLIQRTWRAYVARSRFNQHKRRVIIIQNSIRGFLARKRLSELRRAKLEETSVIKLQSLWRRQAAIKTMKRLRREKTEARSATIIQAAAKGFIARRSFRAKRAAALRIQVAWRATLEARRYRQRFLLLRSAAILIQAQWRGYQGRKEFREDRQKIVICQATVRMVLARREYRRKVAAARIIQAGYRAYIGGQVARHKYLKARRSAIAIQSWYRMIACRRRFLEQKNSAIVLQSWYRGSLARKRFLRLKRATLNTQRKRRTLLLCRADRRDYQTKRNSAMLIQRVWKGLMARRKFQCEREAAITIQRFTRGVIARRYVDRKRAALEVIQRTLRSYRAMKHQRSEFIAKRNSIVNLQRICRAYLARQEFRKLKEDAVYREELRRECQRLEEEKKNVAATVIVKVIRRYISQKRMIKRNFCATVIQKYWRGYRSRVVMREKWIELTRQLQEIRGRLEQATAAAEPKDKLGSRTASAIDYLFSIRDVAELIYAVKTLDMATRLSEDCCLKLSQGDNKPLGQLLNLINRCNRSVPHMEVVTISLDVLLNISRVASTREYVCCVPNLVPDLFQIMVVYRDAGASIFCKVCALLQILSKVPQINAELMKPVNKKKLVDHQTRISTKQRLKEDSQKRRSFNVGAMPPPRKPGAMGNTSMAQTEKKRKGSSSLAAGPPWNQDTRPRFHDDPNVAVSSLIRVLENSKTKIEPKQ